jgi:signal transduction histidine kinase
LVGCIHVAWEPADKKNSFGRKVDFRAMKQNPGDLSKEHGPPWFEVGSPGPETSPEQWHAIEVSASGPDHPEADADLERSFQELVRFYRHSSVGRRCLGIVHRMNTPLQVLSFQIDLLEQKTQEELTVLSGSPPAGAEKLAALNRYRREKLGQMRQDLEKLQDLSRNLVLQGTHEEAQASFHLDLNEVYHQELDHYEAQPFFQHQVSKNFHFQDDLPLICGHYIDFSQSFQNLVDNALEAMAGVEDRRLTVATASRDGVIMVRIGDTGVGMAPGDLPRIFAPFFTTKRAAGEDRAGLGLFMVRRLLAPYGANIRVDSRPGETWVTVTLPAA